MAHVKRPWPSRVSPAENSPSGLLRDWHQCAAGRALDHARDDQEARLRQYRQCRRDRKQSMQPMRNRLRPKTWPNQLVAGRMIAFEADSWSKPRSLRRLMQKISSKCREAKRSLTDVSSTYDRGEHDRNRDQPRLKRGFHC